MSVRRRLVAVIRRAFSQFLMVPLGLVVVFVLLALATYALDDAWSDGHVPTGFAWLGRLLGDSQALSGLLTTVASSIITVTSNTFSLLLIAVQQGASALTMQVTDQFLMRRSNQVYFGFFIGLSVFVLVTLVTNSTYHRPVFASALALIMTAVALCLIVVMIYSTIDQMRPGPIVAAIHGHACRARRAELDWLARSRRQPHNNWIECGLLRSVEIGHFVQVHDERLREALDKHYAGLVEVEFVSLIGARVALNDPIVRFWRNPAANLDVGALETIDNTVRDALVFGPSRDLARDPRYAVAQLSTIGWTSVSTAKSNPSPGVEVIHRLRDLLARWAGHEQHVAEDPTSPFVYPDRTCAEPADTLELMIVVASESMQAQTLAVALNTIAVLMPQMSDPTAERLADISRRSLACLGEHVPIRSLEMALTILEEALRGRGFSDAAGDVAHARQTLSGSIGRLNARSTRVAGIGG